MFLANWRWCPPASDGNFGTEVYFVGFRAGSPGSLSSGRPHTASRACPGPGACRRCPSAWPSRTDLLCRRFCFLTSAAGAGGVSRSLLGGRIGPARAQCSAPVRQGRRARHARLIVGALAQSEKPATVTNHGAIATDGRTERGGEVVTGSPWSLRPASRRCG
jgi:hypothetical protein